MKIPSDASPEVQQAFREIWTELYNLTNRNIDLKGKRIINAGDSLDPKDYATRSELNAMKLAILEILNQ